MAPFNDAFSKLAPTSFVPPSPAASKFAFRNDAPVPMTSVSFAACRLAESKFARVRLRPERSSSSSCPVSTSIQGRFTTPRDFSANSSSELSSALYSESSRFITWLVTTSRPAGRTVWHQSRPSPAKRPSDSSLRSPRICIYSPPTSDDTVELEPLVRRGGPPDSCPRRPVRAGRPPTRMPPVKMLPASSATDRFELASYSVKLSRVGRTAAVVVAAGGTVPVAGAPVRAPAGIAGAQRSDKLAAPWCVSESFAASGRRAPGGAVWSEPLRSAPLRFALRRSDSVKSTLVSAAPLRS